jgi:hypothetical protein
MFSVPLLTLRAVRVMLRIKRRLRRYHARGWYWAGIAITVSEWAGAPLKFVMPVQLIPTILLLTFSPAHFFQRLPLVTAGKKPYLRPPVNFILEGTTALTFLLVCALPLLGLHALRQSLIKWLIIVAVLSSPAVLYMVLLLAWICEKCIPVTIRIFIEDFLNPIDSDLRLCLSPFTYSRITWKRFCTAIIAADIYFFVVLSVFLPLSTIWVANIASFLHDAYAPDAIPLSILSLLIFPVTVAAYFLFGRIYVRILEGCIIIPAFRMSLRQVEELNAIMETVSERPTPDVATDLWKCWAYRRRAMRGFEGALPKLQQIYLQERAEAYSQFNYARLLSMIRRLTAMSADHRSLDRIDSDLDSIRKLEFIFARSNEPEGIVVIRQDD